MKFKKQLGLIPSILIAIVLSAAITLLVLWMQPVNYSEMLNSMLQQPLVLLLNFLPLFLLLSAFAFLLRNVFYSAALVGFLGSALAIANRLKILVRDEPLVPRDFGLINEVMNTGYKIQLPWGLIAVALGFVLIMVALGHFFPLKIRKNMWLPRILGAVASCGILVLLIMFVYSSTPLYNSFTVTNPYYVTGIFNDLGFPYCFCYNFSTYQVEKPESFKRNVAASYETGDTSASGKKVNIIMIMNESFSDITNDDVFTYSAEDDPLAHFNALGRDKNAVTGHIVVPGFAGDTANTEFDILTGMQTNFISSSYITAFRTFNRNLDSLFRVFARDDYNTIYMHPGDPWFYNRENVYKYLGADETLFVADFTDCVYKGAWVSDASVAQNVIARFDTAIANGENLFDYAVTIQNHMSYTADKYGDTYEIPPVKTSVKLSDEVETMLSVYVEGLRDADQMLATLRDYFAASDEPVLLCFFGDHLPYLGDDRLGYRELMLPIADTSATAEDAFCSYETPFVLWCNDAAAEEIDLSTLDLPQDGRLSANFLGAAILEASGRRDSSPWFSFLNDLRRRVAVMHNGAYSTIDGSGTLTAEDIADVEKMKNWSYYKLNYKTVR